jgi:radial spoke head protein 1
MSHSGPVIFQGGERFEGSCLGGNSPLQGTLYYPNGDVYEGSFRNNLRHGHGTYRYNSTGEVYSG